MISDTQLVESGNKRSLHVVEGETLEKQWYEIVKINKSPYPAGPKYSFHPTDSTANPKVIHICSLFFYQFYILMYFTTFSLNCK